jgi:UMF1 family MFS transporter
MNLQPPRPVLSGKRHWSGISILSKRSFHSFATSSFHADDERSSSDDEDEMESRSSSDGDRALVALYAGYDGRPTSRKELMGWYMYAFAAETYVICGIGKLVLETTREAMLTDDLRRFHSYSPRESRAREWRIAG